MKVSVIGTGYVGLVSGVCLANRGNHVTCVDIDQDKVDTINRGEPPIHENGLEPLLKAVLDNGLFTATTDLTQAILETDLTLLAVGTPFDGEHIDLSFIETASQQIGDALKDKTSFHTVVVKSTVVPGTTEGVVGPLLEQHSGRKLGKDIGLGMNPEFLREGEAVDDFNNPDRIVLGGINPQTIDAMHQLYQAFPTVDKLETTPRTAEMIKYTANSLLATLISFSNEIGNLCAGVKDIDIEEVMQGVWLDKRISPFIENGATDTNNRCVPELTGYLRAGCGFGGSCFPKDVSALIAYGKQHGNPMSVLQAVMDVNASQPEKLVELVQTAVPGKEEKPVAVLGLAFKPGTDDVRESAAIPVISGLLNNGYQVRAYDPIASANAASALDSSNVDTSALTLAPDLASCIDGVAAIVVVTAWPEFNELPAILATIDNPPIVVDGRRMFKPSEFKEYAGIGLMRS